MIEELNKAMWSRNEFVKRHKTLDRLLCTLNVSLNAIDDVKLCNERVTLSEDVLKILKDPRLQDADAILETILHPRSPRCFYDNPSKNS